MPIENVKCPECCGPMTSRKNGATGQRFWGCNAYPTCRGTRNTDGEVSTRPSYAPRPSPDSQDSLLPSERQSRHDRRRW